MASIVDSYSESNQIDDTSSVVGQSFTGDDNLLDSAKFYLKKSGSPTGSVYAKVYAHSGTFGTSSVPTGAALAVSDAIDPSTFSTSFALVTFNFSGANRITLTNATKYVVTFEHTLSFPNYVLLGQDTTSPTHAGNKSYYSGGWNADSATDLCFYVYGVPASSPSASLSPSASGSASASASGSSSASPSPMPTPIKGILKIAKSGINVLTNSDIEKLIFSSEYGTLKYFNKLTTIMQIDGTAGDFAGRVTLDHNLGYYPFVEIFVRVYIGSPSGNYEYVPFAGSGVSVTYSANFKVTTTQIVLYGEFNGVSSSVWNFDFLIFLFKNDLSL